MDKAKQLKKEEKDKDFIWACGVKTRDNGCCVICQKTKGLNAHHLFSRTIKDLRWDIDNGITLCQFHHRFSFNLSAHQNPLAFIIWLQKQLPKQLELATLKYLDYMNKEELKQKEVTNG